MADKPASPFAGLDKALLRSTRPERSPEAPPTAIPAPAPEPTPAPVPDLEAKRLASKEANNHASKLEKAGYYATREELDHLDEVFFAIKRALRAEHDRKLTKYDVIRACVAIGLADWEQNGLASQLARWLTSREV